MPTGLATVCNTHLAFMKWADLTVLGAAIQQVTMQMRQAGFTPPATDLITFYRL